MVATFFTTCKRKLIEIPKGVYVLFYTEMWELFGRFGIACVLVLYLTTNFHYSDARAFSIYGAFMALFFAMPVIGGFFADRFLDRCHSIILGASLMAGGNLLLVLSCQLTLFLGLAMVAVGAGFFLPSIPVLVSSIYDGNTHSRDAGFTIYYLGKNLGALLAPPLCGFVGMHFGWNYAYMLSALGMVTGIIVFVKGGRHLRCYASASSKATQSLKWSSLVSISAIVLFMIPALIVVIVYHATGILISIAVIITAFVITYIAIKRGYWVRRKMLAIMVLLLFIVIFEAFLNQGGTTLSLFIERLVDRRIFGITLPAPLFYALDPVFMLTIGPFLALIWTTLAKRDNNPKVSLKFTIALLLLAAGFAVFIAATLQAIHFGKASMWFIVVAYLLFPVAELCTVPVGLSVITRLAPKDLNTMIVGVFMLSQAIASYLTGQFSKLGQVNFNNNTLVGLIHAAKIYQKLFTITVSCLIIAAIVALCLGFLAKNVFCDQKHNHLKS